MKQRDCCNFLHICNFYFQGSSSNVSGYTQSQLGHHYSQARDDKPTGSNLPLWTSNQSSYFDKHSTNMQKNAVNDTGLKG